MFILLTIFGLENRNYFKHIFYTICVVFMEKQCVNSLVVK